jgi:hypothetical protein
MILDDSTGIYHVGEIDFGIKTEVLKKAFQDKGEDCFKEVIMALAFLNKKCFEIWSDSRPEAADGAGVCDGGT